MPRGNSNKKKRSASKKIAIWSLIITALSGIAIPIILHFHTTEKEGRSELTIIEVNATKLSQTVARLDIKMLNQGDRVAFTKVINVSVKKLNYYRPIVKPSGKYDLEITNDEKNILGISHKIMPNDVERITLDVSFTKDYWYWSLLLTVEITYNEEQVVVSDPVPIRVF